MGTLKGFPNPPAMSSAGQSPSPLDADVLKSSTTACASGPELLVVGRGARANCARQGHSPHSAPPDDLRSLTVRVARRRPPSLTLPRFAGEGTGWPRSTSPRGFSASLLLGVLLLLCVPLFLRLASSRWPASSRRPAVLLERGDDRRVSKPTVLRRHRSRVPMYSDGHGPSLGDDVTLLLGGRGAAMDRW